MNINKYCTYPLSFVLKLYVFTYDIQILTAIADTKLKMKYVRFNLILYFILINLATNENDPNHSGAKMEYR